MPRISVTLGASPIVRRVVWHVRRVGGQLDRRFFLTLAEGIVGFVAVAAILITLLEKPWTFESVFDSFNWGLSTVLGVGDAAFVASPGGRIVNWLLILFGVALLATITGALVAMVIDFMLKEGQGLGASGYRDHIVVCGWNTTARDLLNELRGDDYKLRVVLIADQEKNPAGGDAYYVRGDPTDAEVLERAAISHASAALVFPADASDAADMQSILVIMAIESVAPGVRTVAEVNNPRHDPHFRRAGVDELLVTSKIASHLLARSALYPGLTGIITDIVSGGEGSELYRVGLPDSVLRHDDRRGCPPPAHRSPGDAALDQPRGPGIRQPERRLPPRTRRRRGRGRRVPGRAGTTHAPRRNPASEDRGGGPLRLTGQSSRRNGGYLPVSSSAYAYTRLNQR